MTWWCGATTDVYRNVWCQLSLQWCWVGYQVASVVGGGFTPFLAAASSLTLPGTGIVSPFICWLDADFCNDRFIDERQSTLVIAWEDHPIFALYFCFTFL